MISELNLLIDHIKTKTPFVFTKFGDGEYECATTVYGGKNCDGDAFTNELSSKLRRSISILAMNSSYIGQWFEPHKVLYWERLVLDTTLIPIRWFHYHTFIVDGSEEEIRKKVELYSLIRSDKRYKLLIRNVLLDRSSLLLSVDESLEIPLDNWFTTDYVRVKRRCEELITEYGGDLIIIGMGGMGIKCLYSDILESYGNLVTLIDVGSGLDLLSSKRDSRGVTSYEVMVSRFCSLLSSIPEWDSSEQDKRYGHIYTESRVRLGKHLN